MMNVTKETIETLQRILDRIQPKCKINNLYPEDTGLSKVIWVCTKEGVSYGPRIKVSLDRTLENSFSVTISDSPKTLTGINILHATEFSNIVKWVKLNKDLLLAYWEGNLSIKEFIAGIKRV